VCSFNFTQKSNSKYFPANIGALAFGMMLGWSGVTQDDIVNNENFQFPVTSFEFSWIVALMPLGAATSVIFSGLMREKLGTRVTVFLFLFPIIIGYALITIPLNIQMVCVCSLISSFT
jgi:MFS family permease